MLNKMIAFVTVMTASLISINIFGHASKSWFSWQGTNGTCNMKFANNKCMGAQGISNGSFWDFNGFNPIILSHIFLEATRSDMTFKRGNQGSVMIQTNDFGINLGWSLPISRLSNLDFALSCGVKRNVDNRIIREQYLDSICA